MANTYKLVKDYTLVSDVQNGDKLLGQRIDGTTVRIPYQQNIEQDATPVLGGDLNLNAHNIITQNGNTAFSFSNFDAINHLSFQSSATDATIAIDSSNNAGNLNLTGSTSGNLNINLNSGSLQYTQGGFVTSIVNSANATLTLPNGTCTLAGNTVPFGGTGRTSFFAHGLVFGGITTTDMLQSLAPGSLGLTLLSNGSGSLPNWGVLGVAGGGTGRLSHTPYALLCGGTNASGAQQSIATGSLNQLLISQGSGALPTWISTVPVASGGTGRASHTPYAVICGGTTSTDAQQSVASVGTSGQVLTSNGAGALPTFQNLPTIAPASQSNQETGSSTAVYVSPGVQQYHRSAAKAWARFGSSGNIIDSYNVTSVSDTGTGTATVNLTTPMSNTSYAWSVNGRANVLLLYVVSASPAITASALPVAALTPGGTFTDPTDYCVICFGDQ